MAKKDSYKKTYPITVNYQNKELASRDKIQATQKMTERAFTEIERAIGDIYNTENATNSALSEDRLYINSLGRSIGSMSELVPVLSGIEEYAPLLASRMREMTYNVIPHPDQTIKLEVGCKWDMTESPNAASRTCVKNQFGFYRKIQGSNTGICQNTSCPSWSARDGQKVNSSLCQQDPSSQTYRDYKLVLPKELRTVVQPQVYYYSNCGIEFDKYRTDGGQSSFITDRTDPSHTYARATNESIAISGVVEQIIYEYPNLNTSSTYDAVIEVPALETDQLVKVNDITLARIQGSAQLPTRRFLNLSAFKEITSLTFTIQPANTSAGTKAAVSQIWIIENTSTAHRNYNTPLLTPQVLDNLSAGTPIPQNFIQIFDTNSNVNKILDRLEVFSTRFNPLGDVNLNTNRDAIDVRLYGDQKLAVGNGRYLAVTVGAPIAPVLGALMESFVDHVSDTKIHLTREEICTLLADRSYCCTDKLKVELDTLSPATKISPTVPVDYKISAYVYGGFPPYTITIDWGDGKNDNTVSPVIVSGVQTYELLNDVQPPGAGYQFSHTYTDGGTYTVSFDVADDADVFGCTGSLTSQVSPFYAGNPPVMDIEVRLDYATTYPDFVYRDLTNNYNFATTAAADWTTNPTWHVLTQVNNTDPDDGKPVEFDWELSNPDNLTFQLQYEDVSGIRGETINFSSSTANLANDFVQDGSVALRKGSTVFIEDVDYTVNYPSGIITVIGTSIGANESNFEIDYYHYLNASTIADVADQWVNLGSATSTSTIKISDFTDRTDLNTIRVKIRE